MKALRGIAVAAEEYGCHGQFVVMQGVPLTSA